MRNLIPVLFWFSAQSPKVNPDPARNSLRVIASRHLCSASIHSAWAKLVSSIPPGCKSGYMSNIYSSSTFVSSRWFSGKLGVPLACFFLYPFSLESTVWPILGSFILLAVLRRWSSMCLALRLARNAAQLLTTMSSTSACGACLLQLYTFPLNFDLQLINTRRFVFALSLL